MKQKRNTTPAPAPAPSPAPQSEIQVQSLRNIIPFPGRLAAATTPGKMSRLNLTRLATK